MNSAAGGNIRFRGIVGIGAFAPDLSHQLRASIRTWASSSHRARLVGPRCANAVGGVVGAGTGVVSEVGGPRPPPSPVVLVCLTLGFVDAPARGSACSPSASVVVRAHRKVRFRFLTTAPLRERKCGVRAAGRWSSGPSNNRLQQTDRRATFRSWVVIRRSRGARC